MTDTTPKYPGKNLFDQVMTPLGVSRNKLARDIDVPVGRISDIVAGKRGVTPDTALRFAKYFGTTAELWLRLPADYDLYVARTTTWHESEPKVAEFASAADGSAVAARQPTVAADPDTESYPREVPENAAADAGPDQNVSPIREGVGQPEVSPVIAENTVHNDGAADPFENKFVNPLSTVRSDDEDIDIPEPLTAGMNRPEAG